MSSNDKPQNTTTDEADALAQAIRMARQIGAKVDRALNPLDREMKLMGWAPEYRAIVWEAVMVEARQRMEEAKP